jgi:hypothetical protein
MPNIEELKAKFTVERPDSIKEQVAAWAFEDANDAADAIGRLESIDCAGCHSPAPIFSHDMACEIASHWPEIDDAIDSYREATGEAWTPRENQGFLSYLWFAYEWVAHAMASEIRSFLDNDETVEPVAESPADLVERNGRASQQQPGREQISPADLLDGKDTPSPRLPGGQTRGHKL